jgi:hypothetical protein
MRRHKNGKHQRDRFKRLVLQRDEHPPRRISTPLPGERGVAGIIRYQGRADRDMDDQPQRPDRDQPLPGVHRGARNRQKRACRPDQPDGKSPDGIDPPGIAGPLLHHPGQRHQDRKRQRDANQRLQI